MDDYMIDIFSHSKSEGEMKIKMDNLTSMIEFAQSMKEDQPYEAAGNSSIS